MSIFTPSGSGSSSSGGGGDSTVSSPTIQNIPAADKNTQYSVVIPVNTSRFTLQTREAAVLQVAYISGETDINFFTIGYGVCYTEENLDGSGITLYFQANKDGAVVEVLSWE